MNVGIVGIGFMGMIHYLAYGQVKGAKVTAISSRSAKKLGGDWRGIQGNFGPPGTTMDLSGIAKFAEWEELINDPQVDLVDICLPPALHPEVAVAALKAGKHVLCEKPIALSIAEAKPMVAAAAKHGKQLLIAHVLPFFPEYSFAYQVAISGRYGRLLGGQFKRIISEPTWIKPEDFFDPANIGGPVVDLHIHDAHFIRLLFGMPRSVFSTGRWRGKVVEFINSQFMFGDESLSVTATSGVIRQQGRSFSHAFELYFEKATLAYDMSVINGEPQVTMPLTVFEANGSINRPTFQASDAFEAELTEVVRAVEGGSGSALLAGELALDALTLCQNQTLSVERGQPVKN